MIRSHVTSDDLSQSVCNRLPAPNLAHLSGLLLGTALGDSLGLPAEGLSPRRLAQLGWSGRWRHRFLFGHGMVSDDTEHAVFVAESLLRDPDDADAFSRRLAWRLRWWLLVLPAGVGFATLRACVKLWMGFPPSASGVRSAGNGPAMRAPIIGACFAGDREKIFAFVQASTRLTHTDARAFTGAFAVALCAEAATLGHDASRLLKTLEEISPGDAEWQARMALVRRGLAEEWTMGTFCNEMGCVNGITGYIHNTVPAVVFTYLRARDMRSALEELLDCGGDTDTVGAIAGALLGCRFGVVAFPQEWLAGLAEFPKGKKYLFQLAASLAQRSSPPASHFRWLFPFRQLLFTATVFFHGLRRLFPPW